MGMRIDCRNYESRTYSSGEVVRMCRKDLAPEAPWRCPENCPGFERKVSDGGWTAGSLAARPDPDEPPDLDEHAVSMLDEAEDIINAVGPGILAEIEAERQKRDDRPKRRWWPFKRK